MAQLTPTQIENLKTRIAALLLQVEPVGKATAILVGFLERMRGRLGEGVNWEGQAVVFDTTDVQRWRTRLAALKQEIQTALDAATGELP